MTLARLFVILSLNSGPFTSGMTSAMSQLGIMQSSIGRLSGANLTSLGRSLTFGLTLPIIAAAAAIGTFGSQLDEQLAAVQSVIATPADSGLNTINIWRDQIQDLAITLGRTSPEVAGGMYEIVSALGEIPNAMEYLTIASRAAVAGQSDIVTSTKNLVLSTRAWGDSSTEGVRKMADLAAYTVKVGTLTESELGPALANALPIARLYGVGLNEVFASLSSLSGVSGSASQVSTQLSRAITSLVAPNLTMAKLYKQNKIASGEWLIENYGLVGALQKVMEISERTGTPLQKMMGRIEAVKFAATLTGPQLATFQEHLLGLEGAAGAVDLAFEATTNGINSSAFQWTQAGVRLRVIAEDLYQAFAPVSLKVLDALSPIMGNLRDLADTIGGMDTGKLTTIFYTLLGLAALGPTLSVLGSLVTVFNGLRTATTLLGLAMTSLTGPVGLVILGIALLWFAWNNNWGQIQERTASAVQAIKDHLGPLQDALGDAGTAISGIWEGIRTANVGTVVQGIRDLETAFVNLGGQTVIAAIDAVGRFFAIDTTGIQGAIQAVLDLYNAMVKAASLWETLGILWGGASQGAGAAMGALANVSFPQQGDKVTAPTYSQSDWDAEFNRRLAGHTPDSRSMGDIMSGWWTGVTAEFTKGYTTAIGEAVKNTPIPATIGPATYKQVQAGIKSQNFGPAISPGFTTGFTSGVNGANWGQVSTALTTQLKTTTQAPVDAMVGALQTQLGQALASDKVAGIVKPALETAINQAVTTTNFDQVGAKFVTSMQDTMTKVKAAITNAQLSATMKTEITSMATAVTTSGATATTNARTVVSNIKGAFNTGGWSAIGSSISSGIARGITSGAPAIAAAARAAAASAITAAKAAISAKSPSRKSNLEVGLPFSQGVALGILAGMPLVSKAAGSVWAYMNSGQLPGMNGGFTMAGAGAGGGYTINIENNFAGPVDDATIQRVEAANRESITDALRRKGLV